MQLAHFHKLIADGRVDKKLTEREFLGILADTAHQSDKTFCIRTPEDQKQYYRNLMSGIYSTAPERPPLPALKSRAILYQREERFDDVMEYMQRNLADCESVVRDIIRIDKLQKDGRDFLTAVEAYTIPANAEKEDEIQTKQLSEKQKRQVCAAYIAEYYYFAVLWNLILTALPDIEELQNGISPAFPSDDQFHDELIRNYYQDKADACFRKADQMLTANGQAIVRIDRFLMVGSSHSPENYQRDHLLPVKWKDDSIRSALLLNEYSLFLTDNRILVYSKIIDFEKIYRIIQITKEKKHYPNARFLAFDFVPADSQDESKGTLLVLATHFYLELVLERIGWDFSDDNKRNKINKIGKIPDYTLHEIEPIEMDRLCGKVKLHDGIAEYDTLSEDKVERHQLRLGADEQTQSETVFELEGAFRNGNTVSVEVSPNGQYVLLITKDHLAVLVDKNDTKRSPVLCEAPQINATNYADMMQQSANASRLTEWGFSQDSRYFAFTITGDSGVMTEVVDLQTMEKRKLELNGNDQCRFVDFYEDRVLIQWVDDNPGAHYCWYDLSQSSWMLD